MQVDCSNPKKMIKYRKATKNMKLTANLKLTGQTQDLTVEADKGHDGIVFESMSSNLLHLKMKGGS